MQKKPWAKKEIRQQNRKKLRQALQNCGKAESESVEEFEQQILDKSRSMEEYLQNVAKVGELMDHVFLCTVTWFSVLSRDSLYCHLLLLMQHGLAGMFFH